MKESGNIVYDSFGRFHNVVPSQLGTFALRVWYFARLDCPRASEIVPSQAYHALYFQVGYFTDL